MEDDAFEPQLIARNDRPPETRFVDAAEEEELFLAVGHVAQTEDCRALRHRFDDEREGVGEVFSLRVRHPFEDREELFLCRPRRISELRAACVCQRERELPPVIGGALAGHQAGVGESCDNDRDGALIGPGPLRKLVERERRRLTQLVQHEELCRGKSCRGLGSPVHEAQDAHEPADGIEDALAVGHA